MKLSVVHNSVDLTLKMDNFASASKELDLVDGQIYIGYFKPIKNIYIEMITRELSDSILVEYFDGNDFVSITGIEDRTFGLTESGLISWQEIEIEEKTTISGVSQYWYKITTANPAVVEINGINLVLSNDKDLRFVPNLSAHLSDGATSFIAFHQEARNQIIQNLRNSGKKINGYEDIFLKQVDQFDLLDIEELKQASKYLALHLIFDDLSKSNDDQYFTKAEKYLESYEASLNSRLLSIDTNNNGKKDEVENVAVQFTRIIRV